MRIVIINRRITDRLAMPRNAAPPDCSRLAGRSSTMAMTCL
jgi:hypothetical protein